MPAILYVNGKRLERIAPGIYADGDGAMHLIISELLVAHGYVDTEENREAVIAAARLMLSMNKHGTILEVIE